jgi:hypothetical protein
VRLHDSLRDIFGKFITDSLSHCNDPNAAFEPSQALLNIPDEDFPLQLLQLTERFALSRFERNVIMLCWVAQESVHMRGIMSRFNAQESIHSQRDKRLEFVTVAAALTLLSDDLACDRTALQVTGALFECGLLQLQTELMHHQRLSLSPRLYAWLGSAEARAGASHDWYRAEPLLRRAYKVPVPFSLTTAQQRVLEPMKIGWTKPSHVLHLHGQDASSRRAVFGQLCSEQSLSLHVVPLALEDFSALHQDVLTEQVSRRFVTQEWVQVLNREAVLCETAFLFEFDSSHEALQRRVAEVLERSNAVIFLSSRDALDLRVSPIKRRVLRFELMPSAHVELWVQALERAAAEIDDSDPVDFSLLESALQGHGFALLPLNAEGMDRAAFRALSELAAHEVGLAIIAHDAALREIFTESLLTSAQLEALTWSAEERQRQQRRSELEWLLRRVFDRDDPPEPPDLN